MQDPRYGPNQARPIVEYLAGRGYSRDRIRLIVNRTPKSVNFEPGEIEKMLRAPVYCMIPDDYAALRETHPECRLLGRDSDLGKHIARFVAKLGNLDEKRQTKRLLGLFP